jgi:hypothetical protein
MSPGSVADGASPNLGSNVITIAAVLTCVLLGTLAVFQLFLVFGAPLGRFAWAGQHRVLPRSHRVGSVVSIVIYALLAAIVVAAQTWCRLVSPKGPLPGNLDSRGLLFPWNRAELGVPEQA